MPGTQKGKFIKKNKRYTLKTERRCIASPFLLENLPFIVYTVYHKGCGFVYTYEELLHLSALKERKGEKEKFEARLKEILRISFTDGVVTYKDTSLREDEAKPSFDNFAAVKNAKETEDGFISVSEAYYEGKN